jgi:broad specificity phosphatase PhoE
MSKYETEKVVYFVRHGESEHNILPVYQSPDAELSERGRHQASKIAQRIQHLSFDVLISSPFARAKSTAEDIARATGKDIEFSPLFVERIKPTVVNGKRIDDPSAHAVYEEWKETMYSKGQKVLDGENFEEIMQRADSALAFLKNHPAKAIVVVSHSYFIHTLLTRVLLGEAVTLDGFKQFHRHIYLENTGITVLKLRASYDGPSEWRLWIHNDHAHLGE